MQAFLCAADHDENPPTAENLSFGFTPCARVPGQTDPNS